MFSSRSSSPLTAPNSSVSSPNSPVVSSLAAESRGKLSSTSTSSRKPRPGLIRTGFIIRQVFVVGAIAVETVGIITRPAPCTLVCLFVCMSDFILPSGPILLSTSGPFVASHRIQDYAYRVHCCGRYHRTCQIRALAQESGVSWRTNRTELARRSQRGARAGFQRG